LAVRVRSYVPSDRDAVIELLQQSISTNRTADTWDNNKMTAVLAFENDTLIGVLPMEPRQLELGNGKSSPVLWISAAHVNEKYRSQGIGAKLDKFIRDNYKDDIDALCVYRGDEASRAYKWYRKMGYHPVSTIQSFKKNINDIKGECKVIKIENVSEVRKSANKLLRCFKLGTDKLGGFPARNVGYWERLFTAHYYKAEYQFIILALPSDNGENYSAHAVLGITDMRDGVPRIEILEFVASDDTSQEMLHNSIEHYAKKNGLNQLRIQVSEQDPIRRWFENNGYVSRDYSTYILISLLSPFQYLRQYLKSVFQFNLSIKTPNGNILLITENDANEQDTLSLHMEDAVLQQLLLGRVAPVQAREGGRLILKNGGEKKFAEFSSIFTPTQWRYFQSDYI